MMVERLRIEFNISMFNAEKYLLLRFDSIEFGCVISLKFEFDPQKHSQPHTHGMQV